MAGVCLLYTVCDRTDLLRRSLERLEQLTPPDEVLVVDDGGTDPALLELCMEYDRRLLCPVRYLYTHNPGPSQCSHARNVGIKATDAEYVITSEPEMIFQTDVVQQLLMDTYSHPVEFGSAGVILHGQYPGTTCPCCGEQYHVTRNWSATWIACYRREWLLAVGGWDESWPDPWGWEDVDLSTRLRISGVGQFIDPDVVAIHQWHPTRQCDQSRNEAHFKSKGFNGDERPDHPALVANHGDWGVPRSRP